MRPLIIVESPAKAKTIEKFLGRTYTVRASKGHVRDLPKSQLGVAVDKDFEPRYITIRGKGDVIKELRDAAKKAERVYLATDPDREGEAISWHLAQVLGIKDREPVRIVFHEITKDAVRTALRHARAIDYRLVDAQQARRVLDRLVGYQLSPLLWRKVRPGLSAGRVQSATVHLIVEREEEIRAFQPQEYWTLAAELKSPAGATFMARYQQEGEEGERILDSALATRIAEELAGQELVVAAVDSRRRRRTPPPPFTTSTLQQEASRRLGFTVRRTMAVAQALYEGLELAGEGHVGLVTYIRTDSTRIADEARDAVAAYIREGYGDAYAQPAERRERRRVGVQDAHEAIRPTSVLRHPDTLKASLTREQLQLYRLIWLRFVASAMSPAEYEQTTIRLSYGEHPFRAVGSVLVFPGFQALTGAGEEDEGSVLPPVAQGDHCLCEKAAVDAHVTEPPPRYTEATLVKALEERGIGRPSTYAPTIQVIQDRKYVERVERRLHPTELGEIVDGMLREHFPEVVDPEFTAELEGRLDKVEEGTVDWKEVLRDFYVPFHRDLEQAEAVIGKVEQQDEVSDVQCENCGRMMVIKHGRFGRFLACPGYPECKNTKPLREPTGVQCPLCGGEVVERHTRRGRTFYGCANYPSCTFTTWKRPVRERCPECGAFLVEQPRRGGQGEYVCVRESCDYRRPMAEAR